MTQASDAHHGRASRAVPPVPGRAARRGSAVMPASVSGAAASGSSAPEVNEVASRHRHVLRHATVARDPDGSRDHLAADVVLAAQQAGHRPQPSISYDGDPVPGRAVAHRRAHVDHLAGDLMPQRHRQRRRAPWRRSSRSVRQTPAREHAQHDLVRAGPRLRDFDELRRARRG